MREKRKEEDVGGKVIDRWGDGGAKMGTDQEGKEGQREAYSGGRKG